MKFEANIVNRRKKRMCALAIDFDARQIWLIGDDDAAIDETYDSLEAMDRVYRERLVPYFADNECRDIDNGGEVEVFENLEAFRIELVARRTGETIEPAADELDAGMITLANALRERLNKAIGTEPFTLGCAVFHLHDSGIVGATLNGPLLVGKSQDELEAAPKRHPYGGWAGDDFRSEAALDLESSELFSPFEEFGNASDLADSLNHRVLYLACARIEAKPLLRDNVTVDEPLQVLWEHHEIGGVEWAWRETAKAFVDRPARAYFEHVRD